MSVTQVEFPGLTDINGGEELGCSRWSFTRIKGPGARTGERSLGRAQNDQFLKKRSLSKSEHFSKSEYFSKNQAGTD